jgi:hypothetical protein
MSGVICFALCARKEDTLPPLLSTTLLLSISVSLLTSGNRRNGKRSE